MATLMSIILRHYSVLFALFTAVVTPAICVGLAYIFGDICWPQRLGAIYVGIAVLLQGFMAADDDRFAHDFLDGTNLRGHINGVCFSTAVFGTVFAAFGDLIPAGFFYDVPMCLR